MITIDRNYSPPPPKCMRGARYPFAELNPGDSFFVPNGRQVNISGSGAQYAKRNGVKFATRKVVENDVPGVRVWRTE